MKRLKIHISPPSVEEDMFPSATRFSLVDVNWDGDRILTRRLEHGWIELFMSMYWLIKKGL